MVERQAVLAEIVRSGFVEGHHYGSVVALAADGSTAYAAGDVTSPVLPRSCNKPLQAVGMLRAGLDLDGELLAVACASHSGEPFHIDAVRRILAGAGLDESLLQTPPDFPLDEGSREAVVRAGGHREPVLMNCSGKHAAMLATCVVNDWDLATYREPDHPLQRAIIAAFSDLTGEPVTAVAVDGCGAPLLSASLTGLARGFAAVATATDGPEHRVAEAIREAPRLRQRYDARRAGAAHGDPGRDRQGRGRVLLRGGAARRPVVRAQARRRRTPGAGDHHGRPARSGSAWTPRTAWTPRPCAPPDGRRCSAAVCRSERSGPPFRTPGC